MSIQFSYVALYASLGRMSLTYIRGYCHFAEGRAYFLLHYASRLCNDTLFFFGWAVKFSSYYSKTNN